MTILSRLKKNDVDAVIATVARDEKKDISEIIGGLETGKIIIPKNKARIIQKPCGIGKGLRTKVNVNIGTSPDYSMLDDEIKKVQISERYGADALMDLSTGNNVRHIRREILKIARIPVGTVPIYQVAHNYITAGKPLYKISKNELFDVIEEQADDGVDFMTIHCGVTKAVIEKLKTHKRLMGIVSRGGAILAQWIEKNTKENPLYLYFDELLKIAKKYDVTLSLGDGMRPGCLADATDTVQIEELKQLSVLARLAHENDVQVMIEGPGHIPLHEINTIIGLLFYN
ncbi:phosphomethylpyrimidine synthase ThiC, partial [Chlamydiota bacterium]